MTHRVELENKNKKLWSPSKNR